MSTGPVRVLLVFGGHPGGRTERLRIAVEAGARAAGVPIAMTVRHALECGTAELLDAQGILLGTPEHFGYMSGALKDFFDRTFYAVEAQLRGTPYALFVSAGNDGTGAVRAVERIVTGYGWSAIAPPLVVVGEPGAEDERRATELGTTLVAGIAAGIF
jgi:multimeric flavodoxin WrbA